MNFFVSILIIGSICTTHLKWGTAWERAGVEKIEKWRRVALVRINSVATGDFTILRIIGKLRKIS